MGVLLQPATGRRFTLAARTLVGRSVACTLSLKNPRVSGEHAALFYDATGWGLRDLGSSNGTRVNGVALALGERRPLRAEDELLFADDRWVLADDGPPVPAAISPTGARVRAESGILALPDADDPQLIVYPADEGRWVIEWGDTLHFANDGDAFDLRGGRWSLELPLLTDGGGTARTLADDAQRALHLIERLHIGLSRDEETVELTVHFPAEALTLSHRSHHYVITALARQNLTDAHLPLPEQGWMYIEDLSRETGIGAERLYVEVYRARKQFAELDIEGATALFERRSHTRQIRLGIRTVSLGRLTPTTAPPQSSRPPKPRRGPDGGPEPSGGTDR